MIQFFKPDRASATLTCVRECAKRLPPSSWKVHLDKRMADTAMPPRRMRPGPADRKTTLKSKSKSKSTGLIGGLTPQGSINFPMVVKIDLEKLADKTVQK